ncbi:MAG TPA: dienelactone hydrolase family protein [Candidatus Angelobacter sp.]|jgi:carboxymethylenebutenolidase|nr:dienelactone hydrolase family protein [Candidatus Angelobacter sp.]
MKRTIVLATALFVFLLPASAQDWAKQSLEKSNRHQEWVQIKHDNRTVHAFIVYPETKGKATAVVVIHEIFGMTDWVRSVADQLAAAGYIAIAPDLLSGFGPNGGKSSDFPSTDAAREANSKLDPDIVTADLNATADYVKKLPSANGKLAVGGFCWGGGQSFRFATNRKDLKAAFVFYGGSPKDVSTITAPVYGFYGGNDGRITTAVPATTDAMKQAGKKYDPVIYENAGHGFMRLGEDPGGKEANHEANQKAREQAWKRWLDLLKGL